MKSSPEIAKKVKRYKMLGQVSEIAGVITLTCLLGLFWMPPEIVSRSVAAVGIIMGGLLFLLLATYCAFKADSINRFAMKEEQEDADLKTYVISNARIEVLKEKGVPDSVRSFLRTLIINAPVGIKAFDDVSGEDVLLIQGADLGTALTGGLGSQIANQFKDTIFEYTLKDDVPAPPDAKDSAQDASTSTTSSANSQVSQLRQDPVNA